jgi:hypothetical protein
VPGKASPQQRRPVGYGVIRAGVRTDTMIGVDEIPKGKTKKNYVIWFLAYRD